MVTYSSCNFTTGIILRVILNIHGGLGCKSALSYTDHFYIETFTIENSNNVYRKWVQFIDSTKVGAITLLEEQNNPINFKSGTKISIAFEEKDYNKLLTSLSLYLTYTKSNYEFLNKQIYKDLKLGTKSYTHYGDIWALKFDQYSSSKEYLCIIAGIPYKLNLKVLFQFIQNSNNTLDYILKNNRPNYITEEQNKKRFYLFLNTLEHFSFEIKLGIGTVDLSASREDLQYTDKTCTHLYTQLYKMFIDFYKNLNIDVIYNPDIFDAGKNFYKYPANFINVFLKEIHWYKNKIYFYSNEAIFATSPAEEYKVYKLDQSYSNKNNCYVDTIKNIEYAKIQLSERKYIICLQDSKYSKYSKYVKYYLETNIEKSRLYNTIILCIHPDDLIHVKDWIKEICPLIKISDLITVFNKEHPSVKSKRLSTELFKSFKLVNYLERPRAQGLFQYTKEVFVLKEPNYNCYFFDLSKFKELDTFNKINNSSLYEGFKSNLFRYFKSKNLEGDIFICEKQTKNYNYKNWINLLDLILEDCNNFNIDTVNFTGEKLNELTLNIFKYIFIKDHYPIFSLFSKEKTNINSKYNYIYNLYINAKSYLKNNKLLYDLGILLNFDIYQMQNHLNKKHINNFDNFYIPECVEKDCKSFFDLCINYHTELPFLNVYNCYKMLYSDVEFSQQDYLNYINIMEKELNLYIVKNSEDLNKNKKSSEFGLLYNKLINLEA